MNTSIDISQAASITIFGATGDLTARKLMPALFALWKNGFLPEQSPIIGVGRREKTDAMFRDEISAALARHSRCGELTASDRETFAGRVFYRRLDLKDQAAYVGLNNELCEIEQSRGGDGTRVIYMATAPDLFLPAVEAIAAAGMVPNRSAQQWLRIVFEKPFGSDLPSSVDLSQRLRNLLLEDQIYRIDHYLGKETVQNVLLFRFGNSIFEPLLSRNHVDHVQITVAESQGIEHGRGGYYDRSGALRDVLQNHVLQLLALIAMEPPAKFEANAIRDEKVKVLEALEPGVPGDIREWTVPAQYVSGTVDGEAVAGYRQEDRVVADSLRETYVAMEARIDNWRWAGVPFYLRTGKRLQRRVTEIAVQFKLPPHHLFTTVECDGDICDVISARPNTLVFRIQPDESIELSCSTKRPGMQYHLHPVNMEFAYDKSFTTTLPEAYERLLLDVLRGDSTLFTRSDELEAAWRFVTPVLDFWESNQIQPEFYTPGSWGPAKADQLLAKSGHHWRNPK